MCSRRSFAILSLIFVGCQAFQIGPANSCRSASSVTSRFATRESQGTSIEQDVSRRDALRFVASGIAGALISSGRPELARADVSDGTSLPQAAAQFSRVVRLKSDIKSVRKRVADAGNDLEKNEWENIGQFLRLAYSTGDDMKAVASGIGNPENKKRALEDVEQLRKYAQAGDVSVSKRDPSGFIAVADKMNGLVEDFLDSLSDVPDEI